MLSLTWFRIKYVSNCVLTNIALRQSCGRLLLTGAGCIFHLDLFTRSDFDHARAAVGPSAAAFARRFQQIGYGTMTEIAVVTFAFISVAIFIAHILDAYKMR